MFGPRDEVSNEYHALRDSIAEIKRRVYLVAFPLLCAALAGFTALALRSDEAWGIDEWGFPIGLALFLWATFAVGYRWLPLRWVEYGLVAAAVGGLVAVMVYSGIGPEHTDSEATELLFWLGYWLPALYGFIFMVFGVRTGTVVSIMVYLVALAAGASHFLDRSDHTPNQLLMLGHTYASNVVILVVLIGVATILLRQSRHSDRLEGEVHTDVLTGLSNRRFMNRLIEGEIARSERYGHPFSITVFDLDRFKQVNDIHGHLAGDEVLARIGPLVSGHMRDVDTLGRWGGEEFLVLLPEMDLHAAGRTAERLRSVIENGEFLDGLEITASFGVAQYQRGESITGLLGRVDRALYAAKDAGRNRVVTEFDLDEPRADARGDP